MSQYNTIKAAFEAYFDTRQDNGSRLPVCVGLDA